MAVIARRRAQEFRLVGQPAAFAARITQTRAEIDQAKTRSSAGDKGPWKTDYVAMARKTVVRRAFPYLPVSTQAQQAAVADETTPHFDFLDRNAAPVKAIDTTTAEGGDR